MVGGRPVRSSATRRARGARSASGAGDSPSASSRAKMNRSIGLIALADSRGVGSGGRLGVRNDQWVEYGAPWATQSFRICFSASESVLLLSGGGISRLFLFAKIRLTRGL